ncbi:unnamed protein product [Linum trigynum]|uniref:Uncharacterized protein n=1 Tax=Linum trigynum TaxID=586398 RepID=A0AAV2F4X6_9ROSI
MLGWLLHVGPPTAHLSEPPPSHLSPPLDETWAYVAQNPALLVSANTLSSYRLTSAAIAASPASSCRKLAREILTGGSSNKNFSK